MDSKYLSLLLRHKPEQAGLTMDSCGYVEVAELLEKLNGTKEELDHIVISNNKQRFSYNPDQTKIRANQGHSIPVNLDLEIIQPPQYLYHGTTDLVLDSIRSKGILPMNRNHVHLSHTIETAYDVGNRHVRNIGGNLMILKIESYLMFLNNYTFFVSKNGVYLTDHIQPEYILIASTNESI